MLIIDNFDSFTYNIVQALQVLGQKVEVIRNRDLSVDAILAKKPKALVIGPGPGSPERAGVSKELIQKASFPVLGICLGHQAIGEVFGASVVRAQEVKHGKTSPIHHDGSLLFEGLSNPFNAARYHSLILEDLPDILSQIAWTETGEVMGICHKSAPIYGVQFHPDSIATPEGLKIFQNFIRQISYSL